MTSFDTARRAARRDLGSLPAAPATLALAVVVPFLIALAWVPVRLRLPNVDLALVLIAVVALAGGLGSRVTVGLSAVSAALWFEFFDTAPFDRLTIARNPDVETTLILAVVAALVGELAVRVSRHRRSARAEALRLASMRNAAELVASGEELVRVIESVVGELVRLLALEGCEFESSGHVVGRPVLGRAGGFVGEEGSPVLLGFAQPWEAELPVVVQGATLGHFRLEFRAGQQPNGDALLVALTLADNVGAAFLAQAPPPLPPNREPLASLRVVTDRAGPGARAAAAAAPAPAAGRDQETAGFSCATG